MIGSGSYPYPLVAAEEPRGIITVVPPPALAPVALVALVAFAPCATASEGLMPANDTANKTNIMLVTKVL